MKYKLKKSLYLIHSLKTTSWIPFIALFLGMQEILTLPKHSHDGFALNYHWFFMALLLGACSKPLHKFPYYNQIIPSTKQVDFTLRASPRDSLQALYLGCGNLILTHHGESIMIDPFISTKGLLRVGLGKIKIDTTAFEKFNAILKEQQINLKSIKSIWLEHSHYDHLLDLPYMLEKKVFDPSTVIYGNTYGSKIIANFLTGYTYQCILPTDVYCQACETSRQQWIKTGAHIKVMPVLSNHAPHAKFLFLNFHLMKGVLNETYFRNKFTTVQSKTKAGQWREGNTYSYLVDFMKDDTINFRVFIQTSASNFPLGAPPKEVIAEHPVDLAILCAASTTYVNNYPKKILEHLGAKKLMIIHWEDFFKKPLDFDHARLVRFTPYKKVAKRLEQWNMNIKDNAIMPRPGTKIMLRY